MRPRFLVRLRPTLLTTITGLVLLTALTIGGAAAILTLSITRTLSDRARTDAVTAAREETRQLLDEPPRIARQLATAAQRGALLLNDRQKLAVILAETLRNWPRLAIIGYGNIDGDWYVGAERQEGGAIVEYAADPTVNGGVPMAAAAARSLPRSRATWGRIPWSSGLGLRRASPDPGRCGRGSTGSPPGSSASPA